MFVPKTIKARDKVAKVMREFRTGKLPKIRSREQAMTIALKQAKKTSKK